MNNKNRVCRLFIMCMFIFNFSHLSGSFWGDHYKYLTMTLIHDGYDINSKDSKGNTPLHCAAKAGRLSEVKALIRYGADIHAVNHEGESPLHCAAKFNRLPVVDLLIRRGADIHAVNHEGDTPLHRAIWHNKLSVVDVLMRSGADVNSRNAFHQTPLYYAAQLGHVPIIKALVINGKADINAQTLSGFTPLHFAVQGNKPSASRILVELGADTTLEAGPYRAMDYLCKASEAITDAVAQRQRTIENEKIRNAHRVNIACDKQKLPLEVSTKIFEYLAGQGQSEFFIRKNHERHLK